MGTGYTRNDTTNNIADGGVIDAADLDGEFDAIIAAFSESTGHTHDGTGAEGAPIEVLGPAQDFIADAAALYPKATSTYALGTVGATYSNVFTDGLTILGTAIVATPAEINNLSGVTATTAELNLLDGVASTTAELNLLDGVTTTTVELNYVDGVTSPIQTQINTKSPTVSPTFTGTVTIPTVDINGGSIDNTIVGGVVPLAGNFTSLGATGNITVGGTVDGRDIAADGTKLDSIEFLADVTDTTNVTAAGALMDSELTNIAAIKALNQGVATTDSPTFATVNSTTLDTTNIEVTNIKAKDGVSSASIADVTGVMTVASSVLTTTDINGGTIDGVTIGGTTPAAISGTTGSFTGNLTVDTSTLHVDSVNNRVGVGTTSPFGILHLQSTAPTVVITDSDGAGVQASGSISFRDSANAQLTSIGLLSTSNADLDIYQHQAANIDFWTNSQFAMRINSSGNVGIGTANPSGTLHVNGTTYFGNPPDVLPHNNSSGSGATMSSAGRLSMLGDSDWSLNIGRHTTEGQLAFFFYSGTIVGSIAVTASATAYNTSSDYRLKENIAPVQGAADIVKAMQPVTYTFKSDGSWHDGFLAHELQELHPRAVTGEKDAMRDEEYEVTPAVLDDDGNVVTEAVMGTRSVPDYQGVDYSKLTPILTAALQEALNKIDALEIRLAALEAV